MRNLLSAAALFDEPLAMPRNFAEALASSLNALSITSAGPEVYRDYGLIEGVAIIPVQGVLAKSAPWWCESTGYDWIRQGFDHAVADPDVRAIVLDINSRGGVVTALPDLSDHIYESRGPKPIWAILGDVAFSAAYWLACAADHVTVPKAGAAGSVGVITCHVDLSEMLKKAGIAVTYLQYGARKSDGAAELPLSEEARKREQADIDQLGELFVSTVARNRGIEVAVVKNTEAGLFLGPQAVALGLCDEVASPDAALRSLLATLK